MIDVENQVFTNIAAALRASFAGIFVSGEYVSQPPRFPTVTIVEQENNVFTPGRDSGEIERFADVTYQVDVYSNRVQGKKAECKAIMALIDDWFAHYGFTRTFLNPIQNMNDPSIYRMTGRYRAVIGGNYIYRR